MDLDELDWGNINSAFQTLMDVNHAMMVERGFWTEERPNFAEKLALVHSEVSETLEEYRKNHDFFYIRFEDGKPEGIAVELADVVIRIFDLCVAYNIPLAAAIQEKMNYNASRPYKHGGKRC